MNQEGLNRSLREISETLFKRPTLPEIKRDYSIQKELK